jgi:aminoglycoside phosphotransferase (APT) family kinase protein
VRAQGFAGELELSDSQVSTEGKDVPMKHETAYGEKPQTRDLAPYFGAMSQWVSRRLGQDEPVLMTNLEPTPASANGMVGESFILEVVHGRGKRKQRYLLKRKPTQHIYFPDHDFEAEFRVQEAIAKIALAPVACIRGYESDTSILGSPFYLIDFVAGRPVPDRPDYYVEGWLAELPPEDQRAVGASGLRALAQLHSKPLNEAGANFLSRNKGGKQIDWDLDYWDRFSAVSWADGPMAHVPEGRAWLESHKPGTENLVISWGDSRPGNIMFRGTDCVAIIDWDMASAGDPEKDLGYWLAMDLQFERVAEEMGGSRLTGWPSRREMVDIYEQAAGKPVDRKKLRYYRIFAAYQIACMYSRYHVMRRDLDDETRRKVLNDKSPPIDLIREELAAAHLPGCAN